MQIYLIIDIIVLIILFIRAYKGYKRGIINEIARLFAIIAGAIGSIFIAGLFSSLLSPFISTPAIRDFASLIAGFLFIVAIILITGWLTTKLIEVLYLGLLNKVLGLCFGLLNGSLFCGVIIYLLYRYGIFVEEIKGSYVGQMLISILSLAHPTRQ